MLGLVIETNFLRLDDWFEKGIKLKKIETGEKFF
jgi:hypothetical protein